MLSQDLHININNNGQLKKPTLNKKNILEKVNYTFLS